MTAILTLENCDLDEIATASEFAVKSIPDDYSIANIYVGEQVTVKDLIYVLMLHSANEAAYVLAEHVAGSVEEFSKMMNEKAKELGCENTNFVNPNGIQDENHYSSAYDLALITKYAMQNETFREIVKTTSYTMEGKDPYPYGTRTFTNTNHLIIPPTESAPNKYYYKDAIGVKTGYTSAAQNCLVSAANRNGTEYICVVLGAKAGYENGVSVSYRYTDSVALFNYAFDNFSLKKLATEGELIESVKSDSLPEEVDVAPQEDVYVLVNNSRAKKAFEPVITLDEDIKFPIKIGDVIGKLEYVVNEDVYTVNLISLEDVEQPLLDKITDSFEDYTIYYFAAGTLLAIGLLGLIIVMVVSLIKTKLPKKPKSFLSEEKIIEPEKEIKVKKEEPLPKPQEPDLVREVKEDLDNKTPDPVEFEEINDDQDDLSGELNSKLFKKR